MKKLAVGLSFLTLVALGWSAPAAKPVDLTYAGPFVCSPENLVHFENFPVPAGDYRRLVLDMDVTSGPWSTVNPHGWNNLFWMVRKNRNLFMFGYAAVRKEGDKSPEVLLRQGLGVQHVKKSKDIQDIAFEPNTAYHLHYDFDVGGGHAVLTISREGTDLKRIATVPLLEPPAQTFAFAPDDTLTIGLSTKMGVSEPKAPETPSLGWTYRNLHVVLEPAESVLAKP
jgi:hypothetical protein